MKRPLPGWLGWAVLFAWVAAFDVCPRTETMSSWFAPNGTHGRKPMLVLWAFITAHLLRLIPDRFDPLRRLDLLPTRGAKT